MRIAASITSPVPCPRRRYPDGRGAPSPRRVKRRSVRPWKPLPVAKNTSMSPEWPESTRKRRLRSTSTRARWGFSRGMLGFTLSDSTPDGPRAGMAFPPASCRVDDANPFPKMLLPPAGPRGRTRGRGRRPGGLSRTGPAVRRDPARRGLRHRPGRTRKAHSSCGPLRADGPGGSGNRSAGAGAVSPRRRHAALVAVRPRGVRMR